MNPPESVQVWQRKLDFLRQALATAVDPTQKFNIQLGIEEAEAMLAAPTHLRHGADLEILPRNLRERLEAAKASDELGLLDDLGRVIAAETDVATEGDIAWPSTRRWPLAVVHALMDEVELLQADRPLSTVELVILVALPFLVSTAFKHQAERAFPGQSHNETIRRLSAINPVVERAVREMVSSSALDLVIRWAKTCILEQGRKSWEDAVLRSHGLEIQLIKCLADDAHLPSIVQIVGGNSSKFEQIPEQSAFLYRGHGLQVRWKLLVCILTLAELRVLGLHRFSGDVVEQVMQLPDAAEAFASQMSKTTISITDYGDWQVEAICDEPVLDHALSEVVKGLNAEMHNDRARLSEYYFLKAKRKFPAVTAKLSAHVVNGVARYTKPHVNFTLSGEHALRLLMGTELWGDRSLAYRELFQNALDACRYRAARCMAKGLEYTPFIRMHHGKMDDGQEYVECEDNGVGMGREHIASYFAVAGRRFADSDEFHRELNGWREAGVSMHPNSQFGIGVFSYFLVAERLDVETARLEASGGAPSTRYSLRVPSVTSLFRIVVMTDDEARAAMHRARRERGEPRTGRLDAGTRVRLILRRFQAEVLEGPSTTCVDVIRRHVWFSEVDVVVTDYRGARLVLTANRLAPWLDTAVEAGDEEPRLWWIAQTIDRQPGESLETATTFRGPTRGSTASSERLPHSGRVLVDGIATAVTIPGCVINLSGANTPRLALDRRNIRDLPNQLLEKRIFKAIDYIPEEQAVSLINALWRWDSQACHQLRERLKCLHDASGSSLGSSRRAERAWFPFDALALQNLDRRTSTLLELWRLAREMPGERTAPRAVLEGMGIGARARLFRENIPQVVWDKWANTDLGVPEAAALEYGITSGELPALSMYAGWRSGEYVDDCAVRLSAMFELIGLKWVDPRPRREDGTITDYDAWLLGRGIMGPSWIGREVSTLDVLLFNNHHPKQGLDVAIKKYRELAAELELDVRIDEGLANAIGALSDHEALYLRMRMSGYDISRSDADATRIALLDTLVETDIEVPLLTSAPPRYSIPSWDSVRLMPASEHRKVVLREVHRALASGRNPLATLCEVARTLESAVDGLKDDVTWAFEVLGLRFEPTEAEMSLVSSLGKTDWAMIEEQPDYFSSRRIIRPLDRRNLAARIARNSFWFQHGSTMDVHGRIQEMYRAFGWGDVPVSPDDIDLARQWGHEEGSLLESAPPSGVLSVADLIASWATSEENHQKTYARWQKFEPLGVKVPGLDETYLGIRLGDMLQA